MNLFFVLMHINKLFLAFFPIVSEERTEEKRTTPAWGYALMPMSVGISGRRRDNVRDQECCWQLKKEGDVGFSKSLPEHTEAAHERDVDKTAVEIEKIHNKYASAASCNNEKSLSSILTTANLNSMDKWFSPLRDLPPGIGFVDFVYIPKPEYRKRCFALVVELFFLNFYWWACERNCIYRLFFAAEGLLFMASAVCLYINPFLRERSYGMRGCFPFYLSLFRAMDIYGDTFPSVLEIC